MDLTTVLSNEKKLVLATLYRSGIRGIAFQEDDFALFSYDGIVGNLIFEKDSPFDFFIMSEYLEPYKTISLESIIRDFCTEYYCG